MLGQKLKAARKGLGLSLRQLQAQIGDIVSAQAIGKYERGEMKPSPKSLSSLAKALNVPVEYLTSTAGIRLGEIEFRENFIRSKKEESQIEAKVLSHVERYLEIEELLGVETVDWERPREFPFLVRDLKDAEWASHKLRDDWKIGNDPVLNLAEFLEDHGIKVIFIPLPDSVAGVTCFIHREDHKKVPAIIINKKTTGERQRFTLAHELAHLVLENRSSTNIETVCNRFASAFLMPEEILLITLGKYRKNISLIELVSLKRIFGVSIQALTYRCKDLGIISQATYQNLFRDFAQRGWLKPPYNEPELLEQEETQRFKRLCYRALSEGLISEKKAAELLGMRANQIISKLNLKHL